MNSSGHWLLIANPQAGGGRSRHHLAALQHALADAGIAFVLRYTHSPHHATRLASEALAEGCRRFVVIGGDGTLNEVVNGLYRQPQLASQCWLTVFPCGTGNDWAAQYRLPQDVPGFVAMLRQPQLARQDIGRVTFAGDQPAHFFINFAGAGFDSFLLAKMGAAGGRRWRYLSTLLKCLRRFVAATMTVAGGGQQLQVPALMTMACIGRYGGAGMQLAPAARPDDGLLDVLLIRDLPFLQRLLSLSQLFNGRIHRHRAVSAWQCESLSLAADVPLQLQCDGELAGWLPACIELVPQPLTVVIRPAGA